MKGISFTNGGASAGSIVLCSSGINAQTYENCDFILSGNNGTPFIGVGNDSTATAPIIFMNNCRFKFANTGQNFTVVGKCSIKGGSIISGGSTPSTLFGTTNLARSDMLLDVEGFDFSNLASTFNLMSGTSNTQNTNLRFSNCKMPASWSGLLVGPLVDTAITVEAWNLDDGDTNYKFQREVYEGSIKQDTGTYMTGGSTDGTTGFSIKMASSANAEFPALPLYTFEMAVRNETVGAAKTATVEITHSEAADLTDAEIWLEVSYLGTSGFPLSTIITDRIATILGTPAAQTSSTQAWTGAGTRKQKLAVTFTPQEKGDLIWRVALAKASATVYVNANLVIT